MKPFIQNNFSKNKEESKDIIIENVNNIQETPEYILLEWEIIQVIVSLLGTEMYHSNDMYYKGKIVCISSTDIKKKYYEQTNKKLNKVYNKNELISLLSFRDGIVYDNICDIWSINSCKFMNHIIKQYHKDECQYGKDFDKPWKKNI